MVICLLLQGEASESTIQTTWPPQTRMRKPRAMLTTTLKTLCFAQTQPCSQNQSLWGSVSDRTCQVTNDCKISDQRNEAPTALLYSSSLAAVPTTTNVSHIHTYINKEHNDDDKKKEACIAQLTSAFARFIPNGKPRCGDNSNDKNNTTRNKRASDDDDTNNNKHKKRCCPRKTIIWMMAALLLHPHYHQALIIMVQRRMSHQARSCHVLVVLMKNNRRSNQAWPQNPKTAEEKGGASCQVFLL